MPKRTRAQIAAALVRRAVPGSTAGLTWKRQGPFITFTWDGFVAAPTAPLLLARHHYEVATIRRLLADRQIDTLLEVGCGFGRLSPTFAQLATSHVGVDVNHEALAMARTCYPDLDFQVGSATELPFPDSSFDALVTWTVVQHLPPDLIDNALREFRRVLRPTGLLLMCEETRLAGSATQHSWHREEQFYASRLEGMKLSHSGFIAEIDRIPELISPGRVMLFERPGDAQGA